MKRETKTVTVTVSELIDNDLEGLLDIFNERGWPDALIQDIDYSLSESYEDREALDFTVTAEIVPSDDEYVDE